MDPQDVRKLRALADFPALVAYLRDELDWPIEVEDADAWREGWRRAFTVEHRYTITPPIGNWSPASWQPTT